MEADAPKPAPPAAKTNGRAYLVAGAVALVLLAPVGFVALRWRARRRSEFPPLKVLRTAPDSRPVGGHRSVLTDVLEVDHNGWR